MTCAQAHTTSINIKKKKEGDINKDKDKNMRTLKVVASTTSPRNHIESIK